ncbi:MAG TPA: alpha/beta fold hydrolase [Burkholderiales bacterium]|nr:alpha/beta fold hydrolase [Burkholderiales bacterium]
MTFTVLDGASVEYEQTGTGPDLLLLHSLLTDMSVFDGMIPALVKNFRVTRLNLPGYGLSMPRQLIGVADYADHVATVMDKLSLFPETHVFGNGFGAFVALLLAIRHGGCLNRLILADVVATFPEADRIPFRMMSEKVSTVGMNAVLDAAIGRMFPPAFSAAHADEVALRKAALARADAGCFSRACLALAALDATHQLSDITNPTLALCGALDLTTPPLLTRALARGIPGAHYREIAESGHCPMVEQPAALIAEIEKFLRSET